MISTSSAISILANNKYTYISLIRLNPVRVLKQLLRGHPGVIWFLPVIFSIMTSEIVGWRDYEVYGSSKSQPIKISEKEM